MAGPSSTPRPGSICFVTTDFAGVIRNGGIGTHFWLMSRLLARRGWTVHVLFCGAVDDEERLRETPAKLAREGIVFLNLAEIAASPGWDIRHFGGDAETLVLSEMALAALEVLHAEYRFDLIEFPDWGALGLRPVQAKRSGDALLDAALAVKLHSTSQWQREGNLELRRSPRDLKMEFCERFAFEHADVQLSPSQYMLEYTRRADWRVRHDAVVAYPYPDPEPEPTTQVPDVRELVFFGRLEQRKGLDLFLDALESVEPDVPALFLGKDTHIEGRRASDIITERLGNRPHRIETDLDREGALAQLRCGDRLAVIASRSETFGFTVAECVANRIPFIASRAGGIPEVVAHPEAQSRWLFEPTVDGLRGALLRRINAPGVDEVELRAAVAATCDPEHWNARVEATYSRLVTRPATRSASRVTAPPTVTVAVSHFNHDQFLPAALASLAAQTRPPDEVIVVDDGSSSENARRVFAEQEARYPDWSFVRQANTGPGLVRNYCLGRAGGTYFLPFDSDNIATPRLVERLLNAMQCNPSRAATTCHNLAFVNDADLEAENFVFRYSPTGGPKISACLENVFGDTCALFRTEALRSVGGFEVHSWSPHEDWETFVKMSVNGLEVEVLPQPLFYYRTDVGGRLQTLSAEAALTFRQRAHMVEEFFGDAELTPRERRDLWECLLAFDHLSHEGLNQQTLELRAWHDAQMEELRAWGLSQLEDLRSHLTAQIDSEHGRADAIEAELTQLRRWHESQMSDLNQWGLSQLEDVRADLNQRAESERFRADAAEHELAGRSGRSVNTLRHRSGRRGPAPLSRALRRLDQIASQLKR
jgi:glycosyltransferase involved in cell wall biosynthesis/GT2 family glycosyltransferase